MGNEIIRARLDKLIQNHSGEDYASTSARLGKNHAYIHQFIKRGVPKQLNPEDRKILAHYFGVSENYLSTPTMNSDSTLHNSAYENILSVSYYGIQASAGMGALNDYDSLVGTLPFNINHLRELGCTETEHLSVLKVDGDSMTPTLNHGDDILIDTRIDSALKDGIYVLRNEDTLWVKRVSINPVTGLATIKSDNPLYETWDNCPTESISLIGKVIWIGRKL